MWHADRPESCRQEVGYGIGIWIILMFILLYVVEVPVVEHDGADASSK